VDKKTFLDIVDTGLETDDRPRVLKALVVKDTWLYYRLFVALTRHINPELIVELGTHDGTGALHFRHGSETTRIVSVDIKSSQLVEDRLAAHCIDCVVCDSTKYAEFVDDKSVDILFIDANHTHQSLMADFNAWLPKLKKDGIILIDDVHWDKIITERLRVRFMIQGTLGENTDMSRAWKEIRAKKLGETFEIRKLHPMASFGVVLL